MPRRSIEDLKNSTDNLSGAESQALRTFCTSKYCNFGTDLNDKYGTVLREADLDGLKRHFQERSDKLGGSEAAAKELAQQSWGPTKIPVFNVVLSATVMFPHLRPRLLTIVRYLISENVAVDGTDLSGTSTFMHTISTKPYFDLEFAQLLLDAGADINRRNRYGCIAASETVMVRPDTVPNAVTALKWFVERGGDVDIKDGDGMSPKFIASRMKGMYPGIWAAVNSDVGPAAAAPKPKTARNAACPCGSQRKYKKCCGKIGGENDKDAGTAE